jgi:hypothetical protein
MKNKKFHSSKSNGKILERAKITINVKTGERLKYMSCYIATHYKIIFLKISQS